MVSKKDNIKGAEQMRNSRLALTMVWALSLSGCSSIGTVNGVPMGVTNQQDQTFCSRQPEICVVAGATIVGGIFALYHLSKDDDNGGGNGGGMTQIDPPSLELN